jgi:hypothetical protein
MSDSLSWSELVHKLRLREGMDLKKLNREVGAAISRMPRTEEAGTDLQKQLEKLLNMMLLRLAAKEAYYPDPIEDVPRLRVSEYQRPLRDLGYWSDRFTPVPGEGLPANRVAVLDELRTEFPLTRGSRNTLGDIRDSLVNPSSRSTPISAVRNEGVFGPDNAVALTKETTRINVLLEMAERSGMFSSRDKGTGSDESKMTTDQTAADKTNAELHQVATTGGL